MSLYLTCWNGVGTVTGANFLLEDGDTRMLVDCGLLQGEPEAEASNHEPFPYDPRTIDFLFITHAHMDHIGKVGKLVKDGFSGVIFSTPETKDLATVMLSDAVKVMERNIADGKLSQGSMLYDGHDVEKALSLWKTIPYHTNTKINNQFSVILLDAGHILGSSMYKFTYTDPVTSMVKIVIFTGDSGNSPSPLLKDTDKIEGADYLVMDSVYGDRNHEPKDERDEKFRKYVAEAIARGGTLIIPAFSLERTQVVLYELNNLVESGKVPSVPVYLDSPLGLSVTNIYKKYEKNFNQKVGEALRAGDDVLSFPKLKIIHHSDESANLDHADNPKIIIAGSGMSVGGRVVGHEMRYLPDPKSTILLMGYQAIGTLGRRIQEVPKEVEINGELVKVRAKIEMISGYSSHKDSDHLVEMAEGTAETVKRIFVAMGEPGTSTYLAQRLRDHLGVDAIYPERGMRYELQ